MTTKHLSSITLSLLALTLFSGSFLISSTTSAEDESVVDEVNISVPVSCSLEGTGMTSHTATIENGRYVSDIGTTTLKAFCNDNNGFAIYATGYTGDVIGQENSNKLVGTPSTIGNISTGTATSGDTSNWSMKLATTSTPAPTYPITIDNSFNAYKEVPNEYTKVAHRDSSTDIGEDAEGATLTATYASYISKTQAAGAYAGKVIYTLVHPSNVDSNALGNAITTVFDGNGLTFQDGSTTKTAKYAVVCRVVENGVEITNTSSECSVMTISGDYEETSIWKGGWIMMNSDGEEIKRFISSDEISAKGRLQSYFERNFDRLKGKTVYLYAYNPYTMAYDGNGASGDYSMGTHHYYINDEINTGWHAELEVGQEIRLIAPNYKRQGYGFIGWSLDANAASHLSDAIIYGPNEQITIDTNMFESTDGTHEVKMYAIWLPTSGSMQKWTGCDGMNVGDVVALTDIRDDSTYAVAKFDSEKCWMIENLRLGGESPITLTNEDTQSAGVLLADNSSSWIDSRDVARNMSALNKQSSNSIVENIHQRNYAFGNYYSWYTAANLTEENGLKGDVMTSICPSGWKLPRYDDYTSIASWDGQDTINVLEYPKNFVLSGFVNNDYSLDELPDNYGRSSSYNNKRQIGRAAGFYWSGYKRYNPNTDHIEYGSANIRDDGILSSSLSTNIYYYGTDGNGGEGYAVRCVVDDGQ